MRKEYSTDELITLIKIQLQNTETTKKLMDKQGDAESLITKIIADEYGHILYSDPPGVIADDVRTLDQLIQQGYKDYMVMYKFSGRGGQ